MRILCPAKLNLGLAVLGRRPDGYHELDSVAAAIDLQDELQVQVQAKGTGLRLDLEQDPAWPAEARAPGGAGNLAWRAAEAFLEETGLRGKADTGLLLHLTKRVPAGTGLGGGSSDAAGVLRACDALLGPLPPGRLAGLAARLGSDVPLFLAGGAVRVRGRGEQVETLRPAAPLHLVLLLPPVACSTREVYWAWKPGDGGGADPGALADAWEAGDANPGGLLRNDLLPACLRRYPALAPAVEALAGLDLPWTLSGSGSALFALAPGPERARAAAAELARRGWRAIAVRTLEPAA